MRHRNLEYSSLRAHSAEAPTVWSEPGDGQEYMSGCPGAETDIPSHLSHLSRITLLYHSQRYTKIQAGLHFTPALVITSHTTRVEQAASQSRPGVCQDVGQSMPRFLLPLVTPRPLGLWTPASATK